MLALATNIAKASDFIFSPINVSHGLSDNQIRYILQLPDGRMVFTTSGNLNIYDGYRFKYIHRKDSDRYPLNKYEGHYRIYQSEDSLLWIKDAHKLMCVNLHEEKYISDLDSYFKSRGINDKIKDFFVDSDNRWWLLISDGLIQYDTSELIEISDNNGDLQDLISDNDNLYLFYSTGEVICYNLKTKDKLYVEAAYFEEEQEFFKKTSLVVNGDDGLYQLRNGSKGGFFFFDTQKRIWEKLLETDYTLNTLVVKENGTAYISCTHGIWLVGRKIGTKQYLPRLKMVNGSIIHTEISTLFFDEQGGMWLGTFNRGLLYHHPSRYKFLNVGRSYFQHPFAEDVIIQCFAEDSNGDIFFKSSSKVFQLKSIKGGGIEVMSVPANSIPKKVAKRFDKRVDNPVYKGQSYTDIQMDCRGWQWLGTPDGLKLIHPNRKKEQIFYTEHGLINNFIHSILEDRNNNLWITTSYGISKIVVDSIKDNIQFINYNSLDGTLDGEYANGAAFEAENGTLYFGGVNGFSILNSNNVPSPPLTFKPVFTNLSLQGEKIEVGKKYDDRIILTHATPYTKDIELSFDQNFLTLEYSALNYVNPLQTRYRYKLEGTDVGWVETLANSENLGHNGLLIVSYTNLPPGEYMFRVMASDNNNYWEGAVSELKIVIHAPWWKTKTAYILYVISFLSIVAASLFMYLYFTKKNLERQHKEELLLQRIRNLIEQQKLLEEIKDPDLSIISVNSDILPENNQLSLADAKFLSKAIKFVESNLDEPNYSVAQLSSDLCMDRTGLYRKLIALLDNSPSSFIRRIRLQRAAQLLIEEELSITEIAEKVGFSSSSYFSKCFQEVYSCRPSDYAEKVLKST